MYAHSPALEATAPTAFLVWLWAWVVVILVVVVVVVADMVFVAGMVVRCLWQAWWLWS